MASQDGLQEDRVVQRGRSQSDPSSITEVRLGEAHRAGKRKGRGQRGDTWPVIISFCLLRRWQLHGMGVGMVGAGERGGGFRQRPIPMNSHAADVGCV